MTNEEMRGRWISSINSWHSMSQTMNELIQRMITTDARLTEAQSQTDVRLTKSRIHLETKLAELADAQSRSEVRLNSLIDILARNEDRPN